MGMKASKKGLEIVERARIKKGWKRQDARWHNYAGVSVSTLRRFLEGES
jgi:hypothetical protein